MSNAHPSNRNRDLVVLLAVALVRLLLHVALNTHYGFHRDELAVFDDARDLAWGYIAYPPLTPALGHVSQWLFGTSLSGFRFFAAVAQCAAMVFAGLLAREFGGARFAQLLAALAVAATPFSLLTASQMEYTAFDSLWWVLLAWMVARLINRDDPRCDAVLRREPCGWRPRDASASISRKPLVVGGHRGVAAGLPAEWAVAVQP